MNLLTCVLWPLLALLPLVTLAFREDSLEYVLRTIDYLISVKPGVFSVVFYDAAAPVDPRDGIFDDLVQSPRLDHVVKYVIGGSYREELEKVLGDPSLVIVNAGNDLTHLEQKETIHNIMDMLTLFSPWTKLLVFADQESQPFLAYLVSLASYSYSVFFDSVTQLVLLSNGVTCWIHRSELPQPMHVFETGRRWMGGRNITYTGTTFFGFSWNFQWLKETARYLNTDVLEIEHNCTDQATGVVLWDCLNQLEDEQEKIDVKFYPLWVLKFETYNRQICTNMPVFNKIVVPRDRPLNTAELLLMPFSWHVWTLLLAILVSSELVKFRWPDHFNNDPILLVVCGFERHNFHQAGRLEKICFLSLIILMFFMTNAFETKMLSLMTSKPAIQRIKNLADLLESDVKFLADLDNNPRYKELSIMGEKMVQGDMPIYSEIVPGVGNFCPNEFCDLWEEIAFDFERNQPFYVVLDAEYYDGPECYYTVWRFVFEQTFRTMHEWLVEAGLIGLWKQQWASRVRSEHIGRRYQVDTRYKADLSFDDIGPAWMALLVGLSISLITFLAEYVVNRVDRDRLVKFAHSGR